VTDEEKKAAEEAAAQAKAEADAKAKVEEWRNVDEVKKIIADRDAARAKAKENADAAAELAKLKAAQMTDAEKAAARIKELEASEAEAKAARETFTALVAADTATLTDAQKALIPKGTPAEQYAWLQQAKAAGVFGKQAPSDSPATGMPSDGRKGGTMKRTAFLAMTPAMQMKFIKDGGKTED
jgi:colicin import membrane protein